MSQSPARSDRASASGSRSGSRSSSNSMKLPDPAPVAENNNNGGAAAPGAPQPPQQPREPVRGCASIFIGLGPEGRDVKPDELTELLKSKALNPANVRDVRLRGRCAFADTTTEEEANHLIGQLDNQMFRGSIRMAVQMSRQTLAESQEKRRERQTVRAAADAAGTSVNAGRQVFINLGTKGDCIPTDELRAKVEEICPIVGLERRGYCVYVDMATPEDTLKVVERLHDTVMNNIRLIAKVSIERRKRDREVDRTARRRSPRRDERRDGRRDRRRRSDSLDRRHRRSRRSYSPSSRSSSASYGRGRRSRSPASIDSRDRRRRDRGPRRDEPRRDDRAPRRDEPRRDDRAPRRDEPRRDDRAPRRGDRRERR